ncbi:MAG: hypothetical protein ACRDAM_00190 [Casimicrobium sp.]
MTRAFFLAFLMASNTLAGSVLAPEAAALREKSIQAHGGKTLENLKTYREDFSINASVLGIGVYNLRLKSTVDFVNERGRIEFYNNGTLESITQLSKQGTMSWSKKDGTKSQKSTRGPDEEFTFSTPFKSGVLGLLATGKIKEERVTSNPNLEIEGVRGAALIRTGKQYEVTYLFDANGALLLEQAKYQGEKPDQRVVSSLIYNKFKMVEGVRVPVAAAIRSSQMPGLASASMEVKSVDVNPALTEADFKMP